MKAFPLFIKTFLFRITLLIASSLQFSGCQEEISEITEPPSEIAFDKNSTVADLFQRTSQRDGSPDNIIDQSSCLTVKLPVDLIVNGIELTIQSENDFVEVEKIIDASNEDTDLIELIFPIIVIFPDHEEESVSSLEELSELSQECIEDGLDEDIECVDFVYPLRFSIFNSDNQVASVVDVFSDEDLYLFLDQLEDDEFVSLNFPVTLVLYNEEEVVVNDNLELEETIESVSDLCDEDDDNDFDDDDLDDTDFINILTAQNWEVNSFIAGEDKTSQYEDYSFEFEETETLFAYIQADWEIGEWESTGDGGYLELEIDLDHDPILEALSEDWEVIEYSNESISLKAQIEDNIEATLNLIPSNDQSTEFIPIGEIIIEGSWNIQNFINSDVDETSIYSPYSFIFSEDLTIRAILGEQEYSGLWSENLEGKYYQFELDFNTSTDLDDLNDEWYIIEYDLNAITLRNSPPGEDYDNELIFKKI